MALSQATKDLAPVTLPEQLQQALRKESLTESNAVSTTISESLQHHEGPQTHFVHYHCHAHHHPPHEPALLVDVHDLKPKFIPDVKELTYDDVSDPESDDDQVKDGVC